MNPAASDFGTALWRMLLVGALALSTLLGSTADAAPPGPDVDAKVTGRWQVATEPGSLRIYEISKLRYVKIVGGSREDRSGRLAPQDDGSYLLKLDNNQYQRVIYLPDSDKLLIEHFVKKQDMDLKLPGSWKTHGIRKD